MHPSHITPNKSVKRERNEKCHMTKTKRNCFIWVPWEDRTELDINWWQLADNMHGLCLILITMIIFIKNKDN